MKRSKSKIRVTRRATSFVVLVFTGCQPSLQTQLAATHACEILEYEYAGLHYSKSSDIFGSVEKSSFND